MNLLKSNALSWEQRKLGDCFSSLQNNTLSRAELSDENGVAMNVHYGDVLIKFDECLDVSKEPLPFIKKRSIADKFKTSYLQNGDVIVADTAEDETVGKCTEIMGLTDQKVISGLHTIPLRPSQKFAAGYLGFYLNSDAYHDQLKPLMQGIKVTSISKSAMQDTVIKYPSDIVEQGLIGQYFLNLDHLITLHQSKAESWKNKKKRLLTISWEQRKLAELVTRYEDPVETPHDGYVRLGIRSHAKGTFHEYVEPGHELETAQMHRVAANKLIFNITFAWEHAVAITTEDDAGKLVSHRFPQFSLSELLRPEFLKYVILDEGFHHKLYLASPGGAGRNRVLKVDEALDYPIFFPSVEEQHKIGEFLNQLNELITLHQGKLERIQMCNYRSILYGSF